MMKYNVGDKIRVKKDLVVDRVYGGLDCLQAHKKECGKIFTIKDSDGYDYHLNGSDFWWSEEMLEDVESGVMMIKIYQDGNKVIAKKEGKFGVARCSPEDEFDIFVGAKLALERLEEKCKPYAWLNKEVKYFFPQLDSYRLVDSSWYRGSDFDKRMMERGLVFKTEEEAIEAAKKMLEVVKRRADDGKTNY